jgi:hypothetical protein
MSEDVGGENASIKGDPNKDRPHEQRSDAATVTNESDIVRSDRSQRSRKESNCVENGTLLVLFFTFLAAVYAGYEAKRLADATGVSISDARSATAKQMGALERQLQTQTEQVDLSTRPILTSVLTEWQLNPALKAGVSPTISFPIKNVGHSNAQVLSATYEYTVGAQIPAQFGGVKPIENFPGLLPPDVTAPLIVSSLPSLSVGDFQAIDSGKASIWFRSIFIFRDDSLIVYEIRFTGAYSNRPNANGGKTYRFVFPDRTVPKRLWYDANFGGLRCLNAVASEPHDFGCGDPQ